VFKTYENHNYKELMNQPGIEIINEAKTRLQFGAHVILHISLS